MYKQIAMCLIAVSAALAQQADTAKIEAKVMIDRDSHWAELAPDANLRASLLGDRGCPGRHDSGCSAAKRVSELTNEVRSGDRLSAFVGGDGMADSIAINRNGEQIGLFEKVSLPAELSIDSNVLDGDTVQVAAVKGSEVSIVRFTVGVRPSSTTQFDREINVFFHYYVTYRGSLAEVITNAATGGAFRSLSPRCALTHLSLAACPASSVVRYYTDRASRGETIATYLETASAGLATVHIQVNGVNRVGPIYLGLPQPSLIYQTVSTNPNDDNIVVVAYFNGVTNSRRVPIGTR